MARRRLEAGGPVAAPPKSVKTVAVPADYVLPLDVPVNEVLKAIEAELRKAGVRSADGPPLIAKRAGGRVVIPGFHIGRLGGGHHWRGRRFLFAVISAIRRKRGGHEQPKSGQPMSGLRPSFRRPKLGK